MKKNQIIYWISTAIVSIMMVFSSTMYLTSAPMIKAAIAHLGFPDYFRLELGIAKLLGAIILLAPLPARVKEWGYAGFTITFISAIIAHSSVDGPQTAAAPAIFLVILIVSYIYFHQVTKDKATRA